MRTIVIGITVAAALSGPVSGPATAADWTSPASIMPGPVSHSPSWTGCHAGVHIGGLWANADKWTVQTPGGAFYGQSLGRHALDSAIGGGQVGCDYQFAGDRFTGGFVAGVQGDFSFADAEGSHVSALEFGVSYSSKVKSLASVTGRLGYSSGRLLGYARGGIAWERDDYSAATIVTGIAYKAADTRTGWTAGIGAEYAFTDAISAFVEADYYDFGTETIAFSPQIAGLPIGYLGIEATTTVVRTGINFRFGL